MGRRRRFGGARRTKSKCAVIAKQTRRDASQSPSPSRRESADYSEIGKEAAPFVVAGGAASAAGCYLTKSDDEWTDVESDEDADDKKKGTAPTATVSTDSETDSDTVDAKPVGQIGSLRFKEMVISSENKEKLSVAVKKNTTLEWMAFHKTSLTDGGVNCLCQFLEKNSSLKTLQFESAVFTTSELSDILCALSNDVDMAQITISEPIGDECVTQMCKYIGHRLPVVIRSVEPNEGETSRIEISGRHGGGRMFIYMTTVNGKKTFKRYK